MSGEKSWDTPHRRFNALTRTWVLCSPHRAKRPWQGQVEKPGVDVLPDYDPKCFLCPRNKRVATESGETPVNPDYPNTLVFTNDFSALLPPQPDDAPSEGGLFQSEAASGKCKVICFSPKHNVTLAKMEKKDIEKVIDTWKTENEALSASPDIHYVLIFENRGEIMGCSNPHPHCQIWSSSYVPQDPHTELLSFKDYSEKNGGCCLLCEYVRIELEKKVRVVCENDTFVALVPYWAVWPYEIMVLPKRHFGNLAEFSEEDKVGYADILSQVTCTYDNLFKTSFPYSMGMHQSPTPAGQKNFPGIEGKFHFHVHFFPPLLRSATIKKFMVGFELLGEPQRDITAEQSAQTLSKLSHTIHYSQQ